MTREIRVSQKFNSALHLKLNLSENEFCHIINKATNNLGIYINNSEFKRTNGLSMDSFIAEDLFKNINQNSKVILCGNINSLQSSLPENIDISNKLKYDLNDLQIMLNLKKRYYFELILRFESTFDYEQFQKDINGYFYHLKEINIFVLFQNNLFGSFVESEKYNSKFIKMIVKSETDISFNNMISSLDKIFKYEINKKIVLVNRFSNNYKIPDKGYYRKYVDLFYKYFDKNVILFFSDIYKFNFNNLLIEEFLMGEAIVKLMDEKK